MWQAQKEEIEVAVKTLKPGASEIDKIKFLQEAAIMGQFNHPNVVKLHAVVTVGEPVRLHGSFSAVFQQVHSCAFILLSTV